MGEKWDQLSTGEIEKLLDTNVEYGMTKSLAQQKHAEQNNKNDRKSTHVVRVFLTQLADLYNVVLILMAGLLVATGNAVMGMLLILVLLLKCGYMCVRYIRLSGYKKRLNAFYMPTLRVMRDGATELTEAQSVVAGDLVLLESGDVVSFPMKVVEHEGMIVLPENAGESYAITEQDRNPSLLQTGMRIAFGRGRAVVLDSTFTPLEVALMTKNEEDKKTEKEIYIGSAVAFLCSTLYAVCMLMRGSDVLNCILSAFAVFAVICPADLISARKLCTANGLSACSKAGIVLPHCIDTIQQADTLILSHTDIVSSKLNLRAILTEYKSFDMTTAQSGTDKEIVRTILEMATLASDIQDQKGVVTGDAQGIAYAGKGADMGIFPSVLQTRFPVCDVHSGQSMRQIEAELPGGRRTICLGDVRAVLDVSTQILTNCAVVPMQEVQKTKLLTQADALYKAGLFVQAVAFADRDDSQPSAESDMVFLGILACSYVASDGGKDLIKRCKAGDISCVMLTDLDPFKASAVGDIYTDGTKILSGEQIKEYSDAVLMEKIPGTEIFCGLTMQDKARIVECMKKLGMAVVMVPEKQEDACLIDKAFAAIACEQTPNCIKVASCFGQVIDKMYVPQLLEGVRSTAYCRRAIMKTGLAIKLGLAFLILIAGLFLPYEPLAFTQLLWMAIAVLPAVYLFISKGTTQKLSPGSVYFSDAFRRLGLRTGLLFGVILLLAYLFARYTLPATDEQAAALFSQAFILWYACLSALVLGIQSVCDRILLTGGFFKCKFACIMAGICCVLTLVIHCIPTFSSLFGLAEIRFFKGIWIAVFVLLTVLATDLLKYIDYIKREKVKQSWKTNKKA